jgi:prepilin-type N-terminal cleavage/methylation domain-containing protein
LEKLGKFGVALRVIQQVVWKRCGFTLVEALTVTLIIAVIATIAIPSVTVVRRKNLEHNAIMKLQQIASAQKRYYAEFRTFGYFSELVDQGYLPQGYSTRFFYNPLRWGESVIPFIDKYSVYFTIPDTPNSVFFKIDAVPEKNRLNLRTFNVNLFLDGPSPDRIFQMPPVREGLDEFGDPVVIY